MATKTQNIVRSPVFFSLLLMACIGQPAGNGQLNQDRHPVHTPPRPTVHFAQATVFGSFDKDRINEILERHNKNFLECYRRGLEADSGLRGHLKIKYALHRGRVTHMGIVQNTLHSPAVETCIANELKRIVFYRAIPGLNRIEQVVHFKQ